MIFVELIEERIQQEKARLATAGKKAVEIAFDDACFISDPSFKDAEFVSEKALGDINKALMKACIERPQVSGVPINAWDRMAVAASRMPFVLVKAVSVAPDDNQEDLDEKKCFVNISLVLPPEFTGKKVRGEPFDFILEYVRDRALVALNLESPEFEGHWDVDVNGDVDADELDGLIPGAANGSRLSVAA